MFKKNNKIMVLCKNVDVCIFFFVQPGLQQACLLPSGTVAASEYTYIILLLCCLYLFALKCSHAGALSTWINH